MDDKASFHSLHVVASLRGGAARHVLHLCGGFKARGIESTVACGGGDPAAERLFNEAGVPLAKFRFDGRMPVGCLTGLRRLFDGPYTHIHLHGHRAAVLARLAMFLKPKRAPVLYTVHGYHPGHYRGTWAKRTVNTLERWLESRVDWYVCVSESTRAELVQSVPNAEKRCGVIPNGIPILNLSPAERASHRERFRNEYNIPRDAFVIGTVARMQWQKSVHRLLQAFSLLAAADPGARLVLVGGGPDARAIRDLAKKLRVGERTSLVGEVADTRPLYCMMDLFVLPSLWEGLPLTVLEAWDMNVPVVATGVSGSRDLIDDGVNGFIATNTATGIAQAVERARGASDQFPEITRAARERLVNEFSLENMIGATEKLYKTVYKRFLKERKTK